MVVTPVLKRWAAWCRGTDKTGEGLAKGTVCREKIQMKFKKPDIIDP